MNKMMLVAILIIDILLAILIMNKLTLGIIATLAIVLIIDFIGLNLINYKKYVARKDAGLFSPLRDKIDINFQISSGRFNSTANDILGANRLTIKEFCIYQLMEPLSRFGYRKHSSISDDTRKILNSDDALLYGGMVYYLYIYEYIKRKNYGTFISSIADSSNSRFYELYRDSRFLDSYKKKNIDSGEKRDFVFEAATSVEGEQLAYNDIATDITRIIMKYIAKSDNYTFLPSAGIQAWAENTMPMIYEFLDKLHESGKDYDDERGDYSYPPDNDGYVAPISSEKGISAGFSTVTFMDTIGLGDWLKTPENIKLLVSCVEEFGKVISGYSGEFHIAYLEYVELVFHGEANSNRLLGFSMHFPCQDVWNLIVTTGDSIIDERVDRFCKCLRFHRVETVNKDLPIRLVCADVLPSFCAGEEISMAVAAFPVEIHYYSNENTWARQSDKELMGKPANIEGTIEGWFGDLSIIRATVKSISRCSGRNIRKEQKFFYCVTVGTDYGDIGIYHAENIIDAGERQFIKEGACVFACCVIQGDVAIGKYENGAVYDEENCLKLLKDCFENKYFLRSRHALAKDVTMVSHDMSITGRGRVINFLDSFSTIGGKYQKCMYVYFGKVDGYYGNREGESDIVGKSVLILSTFRGPSYFREIVSIEMDEQNKISQITSRNIEDYSISIQEDCCCPADECKYLLLIQRALYSGNCSRLINYFAYDIEYTNYGQETEKGCYAVLKKLEEIPKNLWVHYSSMGTSLIKIIGGEKQGKMGLKLNFTGIDKSKNKSELIFIEIRGNKIVSLNIEKKEHTVEEIKPEKGNNANITDMDGKIEDATPMKNSGHTDEIDITADEDEEIKFNLNEAKQNLVSYVPNGVEEWLGIFKYWISGEAIPRMWLYKGIAKDCALIIDNGLLRTWDGKVASILGKDGPVTRAIDDILKQYVGRACKIEKTNLYQEPFHGEFIGNYHESDNIALVGKNFAITVKCNEDGQMKLFKVTIF